MYLLRGVVHMTSQRPAVTLPGTKLDDQLLLDGDLDVIPGRQCYYSRFEIGTIQLQFDANTTTFHDLARDDRLPERH